MKRGIFNLRIGVASTLLCGLGMLLAAGPGSVEAAAKQVKFNVYAHRWDQMNNGEWFLWLATAGTKSTAHLYPLDQASTLGYYPRRAANIYGAGKLSARRPTSSCGRAMAPLLER